MYTIYYMMINNKAFAILDELGIRGKARFSDLLPIVGNTKTLSAKLRRLRSMGLVSLRGRYYSLTEKGRVARLYMRKALEAIERYPRIRAERVPRAFSDIMRRYCELLYDRFGGRLRSVVLFGSVARGSWDENSDIDVIVVVDDWRGPSWRRTRELLEVRGRLRETREYREFVEGGHYPIIQNYPLSTREAEGMRRIYLDASVEGIILYDREDFMGRVLAGVRDRLSRSGAVRAQLPGRGHYWILECEE